MKYLLCLSGFLVSAALAQAGGFGGPPPFTNGSPLISGVDGSYQATARGTNLTGVFRFTYSGGRQTSDPTLPTGSSVSNLLTDPYNDYVFFVEGLVYRGLVQANINDGSVSGILDNGSPNVPVFGDTGGGLGVTAFMNGYFLGEMDLNSPDAYFDGKGKAVVTYTQPNESGDGFVFTDQFERSFRFRGVRNSMSTSSPTTSTDG